MDLHTLLKSIIDSIDSIAKHNILGISIFIWLALFTALFLIFAAIEKKMRQENLDTKASLSNISWDHP